MAKNTKADFKARSIFPKLLLCCILFSIGILFAEDVAIWDRLSSGQDIKAQSPFEIRKFEPVLNGKWIGQAVAYGCYREGQAPGQKGPSQKEILEDLQIIQIHWNLIRVYNADDDAENILATIRENKLPIRMMLGVWLQPDANKPDIQKANLINSMRAVKLSQKYPDLIQSVVVGNETQVFWSWHKMDTASLINYIRAIRSQISMPVSTADDYNFWNKQESHNVADEVDYIMCHIYPLWNGKNLETAIPWLSTNFAEVQKMHPKKQVVLGEIGWATNYNPAKTGDGEQGTLVKGEVGIQGQEEFLMQLDQWIHQHKVVTFLFEAFDEPWKGGGDSSPDNEIEKHWGVFYENRSPKESFTNYLRNKQQMKSQGEDQ